MRPWLVFFFTLTLLPLFGQDFRHYDYRKADSIAACTQMGKGEKYVDVTRRLVGNLSTEQEKFRAIFRWVCAHLEYT